MVPKLKTHDESYQKWNQDNINPSPQKKIRLSNHNSIKNQMEKNLKIYLGLRPVDQPR